MAKRYLKYVWPFYNIMHEKVNMVLRLIFSKLNLLDKFCEICRIWRLIRGHTDRTSIGAKSDIKFNSRLKVLYPSCFFRILIISHFHSCKIVISLLKIKPRTSNSLVEAISSLVCVNGNINLPTPIPNEQKKLP